ncbi:MAG: T9SS type A sorting domain-containing protein [Flavobacterium sp.]|nr:T9SS type A sorting domain-containing protein [Flavobacterium sp.]
MTSLKTKFHYRTKSQKTYLDFCSNVTFFKTIFICIFLISSNAIYSQVDSQKNNSTASHSRNQEQLSATMVCVPPTALSYTVNSAFYCTGIPITPNLMSYSGDVVTSIVISPDLPVGLSFNTLNGTISGTPTVAVAGNYTVIINNPCGFTSRTLYIAVSSGTNYYADTDGDGYGTGVATVSCTGQPANTSTNDTDCAPTNPLKWRTSNLYIDQDGDRYSNGFPAVATCYGATVPVGFTSRYIGTDCLDTTFEVNPNAVEVPGNSIDDNCDGFIDEITTTSYLVASSCGITVPTLSATLFAQVIAGAQGYRFEVTNGPNVAVFETNLNRFNLLNLSPGVTFSSTNTVNSVRVAVKLNGFWRAYGLPCIVNTPPVPNSTSVNNPVCGSFLRDIWDSIFCFQIQGATGYRFRVKKDGVLVGTVDSNVNSFRMVSLGISNINFATSYTVDVLLKFNSTWLPDTEYGTSCVIVTPPTPGVSRISIPSCGSSTNSLWQSIFAVPITGAQGYKFVFDNGVRYREYITTSSSMSIFNIPGGPMVGTTYSIRVDVLYNNSYVPGRETCTLTILPTATRLANEPLGIFDVKSTPNPFTNNFNLNLNTSSEEPIEIKVYDMFGRSIAVYQDTVENIASLAIGESYSSGVYNIVVSQGTSNKTLRVIKR